MPDETRYELDHPDTARQPAGGACRLRRAILFGVPTLAVAAAAAALPGRAGEHALIVRSAAEYAAALRAQRKRSPVALVDISADWCAACKVIDRTALVDPRVIALLERLAFIRIDVTAMDPANRALLRKLDAAGPPTLFVVETRTGREVPETRSIGIVRAESLLARLAPFAG